MERLKAWQW